MSSMRVRQFVNDEYPRLSRALWDCKDHAQRLALHKQIQRLQCKTPRPLQRGELTRKEREELGDYYKAQRIVMDRYADSQKGFHNGRGLVRVGRAA